MGSMPSTSSAADGALPNSYAAFAAAFTADAVADMAAADAAVSSRAEEEEAAAKEVDWSQIGLKKKGVCSTTGFCSRAS